MNNQSICLKHNWSLVSVEGVLSLFEPSSLYLLWWLKGRDWECDFCEQQNILTSSGSWGLGSLMALLRELLHWPFYFCSIKSTTKELDAEGKKKKKATQNQIFSSSCWGKGEGSCGCCTLWSAICWLRTQADTGALFYSTQMRTVMEKAWWTVSVNNIEMRIKSNQKWSATRCFMLLLKAESLH